MARAFEHLTWAVLNQFLGRKEPNALGVVTNAQSLEVFPVPQGQEHVDFVPSVLNITKDQLLERPTAAEHIIPSIIEFAPGTSTPYIIKSILTGISGLEIGFGIRHEKKDLENAHKKVLAFASTGDFSLSDDFQAGINYKYAKKGGFLRDIFG